MESKLAGRVLEISSKPSTKDANVVYHNLIVYEFGKGAYGLHSLGVKPVDLPKAQALVGKDAEVNVFIFIGKDRTSLSFVSGTPVKA